MPDLRRVLEVQAQLGSGRERWGAFPCQNQDRGTPPVQLKAANSPFVDGGGGCRVNTSQGNEQRLAAAAARKLAGSNSLFVCLLI